MCCPLNLHMILIPYVPWHYAIPPSFDELKDLADVSNSIFNLHKISKLPSKGCENGKLFENSLLHAILSPPARVHDVSALVKGSIKEVEDAYIGPHQIELILSLKTREIPHVDPTFLLEILESVMVSDAFNYLKPVFYSKLFQVKVISGSGSEVEELVSSKHFHERPYTLSELHNVWFGGSNAFNMKGEPWKHSFFPNLVIVSEKVEDNHIACALLRSAIALASLYFIHESLRSAAALLRVPLREMTSNYFNKWENRFSWVKRNLIGLDVEASTIKEEIVNKLSTFSKAIEEETISLFSETYGIPWFPFISGYLGLYKSGYEVAGYIKSKDIKCSFNPSPEDASKILFEDVNVMARACTVFAKELEQAYRFFINVHRRRLESNRIIATLLFNILLSLTGIITWLL